LKILYVVRSARGSCPAGAARSTRGGSWVQAALVVDVAALVEVLAAVGALRRSTPMFAAAATWRSPAAAHTAAR
jgi:hypothetical protein